MRLKLLFLVMSPQFLAFFGPSCHNRIKKILATQTLFVYGRLDSSNVKQELYCSVSANCELESQNSETESES
jgi:hypothetical protein